MAAVKSGTVIRSTGSWNTVLFEDQKIAECKLRGHFRQKGLRTTNPLTVGDKVEVEFEEGNEQGVIVEIEDRRNYVIRKSVNLSKEAHIIASNLDRAIVIATVEQPRTSYGFIDRFLCVSEAYGIPASIVINKTDLYNSEGANSLLDEYKLTYQSIGYKVLTTSATELNGIQELQEYLKDKTTLISGHSGVGKSTLINALKPDLELKTGEISDVHSKGKHTTTFAEMFRLDNGGFIIDTPGIKELGMVDMKPSEVSHYFPEIFTASEHCKFNNCGHRNEPGCEVKSAVESGVIPETRYASYISIVESIE